MEDRLLREALELTLAELADHLDQVRVQWVAAVEVQTACVDKPLPQTYLPPNGVAVAAVAERGFPVVVGRAHQHLPVELLFTAQAVEVLVEVGTVVLHVQ